MTESLMLTIIVKELPSVPFTLTVTDRGMMEVRVSVNGMIKGMIGSNLKCNQNVKLSLLMIVNYSNT
mgnify:CR=1 FL=1